MRQKLNVLEFLKKGSGIHIKKENKGKFTDYCGGKVTSSCIAKGKNSSDPAVRKRATFAANARKWKHQEGGVLKAQEGSKVDPQLINGLANGIMNFATTFAQNKVLDSQAKAQKAQNEQEWSQTVKEIIKQNQLKRAQNFKQWMSDYQQGLTLDNPSQIVANHFGYNELQNEISEGKNALKNKNAQIDAQIASQKSSGWIDAFGGLASLLGNKLSSTGEKSSSNKSTNMASNYQNNTLDFWNNPLLSGNNSFKTNSYLYNPDKFWNLGK